MRVRPPKLLAVASVLACLACGRSEGRDFDRQNDLPSRVRGVFTAKCSECHGRHLQRPRGSLYVDDLGQLAARKDLVVPFKVEESYLWRLLRDDEMPAKGAKAGPLNQDEKEIVRAWIAAGAPLPSTPPARVEAPPAAEPEYSPTPAPAAPSPSLLAPATRLLGWLGRFHIVVIHFPIALLAAAALAEILAAWRSDPLPDPTVRFCVLLGAAGAIAAAGLGWLHADFGGFGAASADSLSLHRWLGTTSALWAVTMALMSERESRCGRRTGLFRLLLWAAALLVAATGHFGGLLVHGDRFFEW